MLQIPRPYGSGILQQLLDRHLADLQLIVGRLLAPFVSRDSGGHVCWGKLGLTASATYTYRNG